jgi:hypothetical protein
LHVLLRALSFARRVRLRTVWCMRCTALAWSNSGEHVNVVQLGDAHQVHRVDPPHRLVCCCGCVCFNHCGQSFIGVSSRFKPRDVMFDFFREKVPVRARDCQLTCGRPVVMTIVTMCYEHELRCMCVCVCVCVGVGVGVGVCVCVCVCDQASENHNRERVSRTHAQTPRRVRMPHTTTSHRSISSIQRRRTEAEAIVTKCQNVLDVKHPSWHPPHAVLEVH